MMIVKILYVEALVVGLSAIFLSPIAIVHALGGHWLGLNAYTRAAAWGGVFLFACLFVAVGVSQ